MLLQTIDSQTCQSPVFFERVLQHTYSTSSMLVLLLLVFYDVS